MNNSFVQRAALSVAIRIQKREHGARTMAMSMDSRGGLVPALWVLLLAWGCSPIDEPARPPNVILILADDLGWTDLGFMGSDFYETPNIDRLASSGVRFTNAYAATTVCSPTRASVLTGKYPARLHVTDWIHGHARPWAKLRVPKWTEYLPLEETTLAEALKPGSRDKPMRTLAFSPNEVGSGFAVGP